MGGTLPGEPLVETVNCALGTASHGGAQGASESQQSGVVKAELQWKVRLAYGTRASDVETVEVHGGFKYVTPFTVDLETDPEAGRLVHSEDFDLDDDRRVSVSSISEGGGGGVRGKLPEGLKEREVYYLRDNGTRLSLTEGGEPVAITGLGVGTHYIGPRRPLEIVKVIDGKTIGFATVLQCVDNGW